MIHGRERAAGVQTPGASTGHRRASGEPLTTELAIWVPKGVEVALRPPMPTGGLPNQVDLGDLPPFVPPAAPYRQEEQWEERWER